MLNISIFRSVQEFSLISQKTAQRALRVHLPILQAVGRVTVSSASASSSRSALYAKSVPCFLKLYLNPILIFKVHDMEL